MYANYADWNEVSPEEFQAWLIDNAPTLGLDVEQFKADLTSDEMATLAQDAWEQGQQIGLPGTPFITLNNNPYNGQIDVATISTLLKLIELEDQQYSECPPKVIDPLKEYTATIQTQKGDIVLKLYPEIAPVTVNSFVFLAQEGWFDGVTFHRVLPGFMAQAGDPTGTGIGGPGYAFEDEINAELVFDQKGLLAMANSGPNTNGSQFFITLGPAEHLNGNHTIFGEVIEGMDVVESLAPRDPSEGPDLPLGDEIISVDIVEQ